MFYGYESESQMREFLPRLADRLVSIAETSEKIVCSAGKHCTGSIDGREFLYSDGSRDFGRPITRFRAKHQGMVVSWYADPLAMDH